MYVQVVLHWMGLLPENAQHLDPDEQEVRRDKIFGLKILLWGWWMN